jgi:hypothetical protein
MDAPKIVKAPEGCEDYLTPGKEYKVRSAKRRSDTFFVFEITDDEGGNLFCLLRSCGHLVGKDWIIVE